MNHESKISLSRLAAAAGIYVVFAVYLYLPHFKHFSKPQYLFVANISLASVGCFVLSRRWVVTFAGSFLAGAIYGFGPFLLGLGGYHPTAGFLAAIVPWLFCPAAFGPKTKWRWTRGLLSSLPFLAILLFFHISTRFRLFAIPTQVKLHLADLAGLLTPLVIIKRSTTFVGFYHVPIAPLIMGISMLLTARRFGIMIILTAGTILAFCDSFLNISPIIWLTIPAVCCSVLIGAGAQGLASAGFNDRKWVLAIAIVMGSLAIVTLLLATKYFQIFAGLGAEYAKLFTETAKMYILGAITMTILFFIARAKLRIGWLRWVILCSSITADIFIGARFIIDKTL